MYLGELIYNYRAEHKLTLREFSSKCGLSVAYLSQLERNVNPKTGDAIVPTIETFLKVSRAMNMSLDDVLHMVDENQPVGLNYVNNFESEDLPSSTPNNLNRSSVDIGATIKERRKAMGISAEQLADLIKVSPATIYRYESGNIENMGIDKLTPIARCLHTTEAYLMGWIDDPSPTAMRSPSSTEDITQLTDGEAKHLYYYRKLNEAGQSEADKHLAYLNTREEYERLPEGIIKKSEDVG